MNCGQDHVDAVPTHAVPQRQPQEPGRLRHGHRQISSSPAEAQAGRSRMERYIVEWGIDARGAQMRDHRDPFIQVAQTNGIEMRIVPALRGTLGSPQPALPLQFGQPVVITMPERPPLFRQPIGLLELRQQEGRHHVAWQE